MNEDQDVKTGISGDAAHNGSRHTTGKSRSVAMGHERSFRIYWRKTRASTLLRPAIDTTLSTAPRQIKAQSTLNNQTVTRHLIAVAKSRTREPYRRSGILPRFTTDSTSLANSSLSGTSGRVYPVHPVSLTGANATPTVRRP